MLSNKTSAHSPYVLKESSWHSKRNIMAVLGSTQAKAGPFALSLHGKEAWPVLCKTGDEGTGVIKHLVRAKESTLQNSELSL